MGLGNIIGKAVDSVNNAVSNAADEANKVGDAVQQTVTDAADAGQAAATDAVNNAPSPADVGGAIWKTADSVGSHVQNAFEQATSSIHDGAVPIFNAIHGAAVGALEGLKAGSEAGVQGSDDSGHYDEDFVGGIAGGIAGAFAGARDGAKIGHDGGDDSTIRDQAGADAKKKGGLAGFEAGMSTVSGPRLGGDPETDEYAEYQKYESDPSNEPMTFKAWQNKYHPEDTYKPGQYQNAGGVTVGASTSTGAGSGQNQPTGGNPNPNNPLSPTTTSPTAPLPGSDGTAPEGDATASTDDQTPPPVVHGDPDKDYTVVVDDGTQTDSDSVDDLI